MPSQTDGIRSRRYDWNLRTQVWFSGPLPSTECNRPPEEGVIIPIVKWSWHASWGKRGDFSTSPPQVIDLKVSRQNSLYSSCSEGSDLHMFMSLPNRTHHYLLHSALEYFGNKHLFGLDCWSILTWQKRVYLTRCDGIGGGCSKQVTFELPPYGEKVSAWVSDILKLKIWEKQCVWK